MKVNVIKDRTGTVVATFEHPARADAPRLRPALKPGHKVHEVEAPENYKTDMKAFYAQHSR